MRQLIGSTGEWAANDIVLGYGEIGIERVSVSECRAKVGDGASKWSALPYLTALSNGISTAEQAALDTKLSLTGGTMTGDIILAHAAAKPMEPVPLSQFQGAITRLDFINAGQVQKAGDTMLGSLLMAADAAKPMEPVTLQQFQGEITRLDFINAGQVQKAGDTMQGPLLLARDAAQSLEPVTLQQMKAAVANVTVSVSGGLVFVGTVDLTVPFASPNPLPTTSGQFYTVSKSGAVDGSWAAQLVKGALATVSVGDYIVWNATANKFDYISHSIDLSGFVPLNGTIGMIGQIGWGSPKKGVNIINGNGGTIDGAVIDEGIY
jgi:hypothetical protein